LADVVDGEVEPQREELPTDCFCWWLEAAGLESKKLPPLKPEKLDVLDLAAGFDVARDPRAAKASVWAGFGDVAEPKLRLLKASLSPPNEP
jgi:hypothetical protein